MLEQLPILAVVLIYPDGEIEVCKIEKHKYHIQYLKELLKTSSRFSEICERCDFSLGPHMEIDRVLSRVGVIALYNFNIQDIIKDSRYIYYTLPSFDVFLPKSFGSLRQIEKFDLIFNNYPEDKISYAKLKNNFQFEANNHEELEQFIEEERKKFPVMKK